MADLCLLWGWKPPERQLNSQSHRQLGSVRLCASIKDQIKRETPTSAEFCCKKTNKPEGNTTPLGGGLGERRSGREGGCGVVICTLNLPQLTFISKGPVITDPSTDGPSDFPNSAPTPCRRHVKVNDATAAQSPGWCAEADNIDPLSPSALDGWQERVDNCHCKRSAGRRVSRSSKSEDKEGREKMGDGVASDRRRWPSPGWDMAPRVHFQGEKSMQALVPLEEMLNLGARESESFGSGVPRRVDGGCVHWWTE